MKNICRYVLVVALLGIVMHSQARGLEPAVANAGTEGSGEGTPEWAEVSTPEFLVIERRLGEFSIIFNLELPTFLRIIVLSIDYGYYYESLALELRCSVFGEFVLRVSF